MNEHTDRVWRTLRYLRVPEADLADASQEVFLVVFRRLPEFRGQARLSTWIYEICLRIALASKRRAAARKELPLGELPERVNDDAPPDSDRVRARQVLAAALEQLPDEQRAVIVLHEIEELSMRRVAAILGCPLFTAYSRHRLARKRLKQLLAEGSEESTS